MNATRRGLNRALLGLLGLLLIGAGALAVLAGTNTDLAKGWTRTGNQLWAGIQEQLAAVPIPGLDISWWTAAVLGLLLLAVVLLVAWIASQGGGRTNQLARHDGDTGATTVDTAVAGQAIKAALTDNTQVLSSAVQSWHIKGRTGLKISVQARKGASPRELVAELSELVSGLDAVLGEKPPVLVRIQAGTRSRFSHRERVA